MALYSRIANVLRKCPVCGEPVWDIIYGTGDMTRWNSSISIVRMRAWEVTGFRAYRPCGNAPADACGSVRSMLTGRMQR